MSRVTIDTDGSVLGNTLRDHLLPEKQEVLAELKKCDDARSELLGRLKFIEAVETQCKEHGIELRDHVAREAVPRLEIA